MPEKHLHTIEINVISFSTPNHTLSVASCNPLQLFVHCYGNFLPGVISVFRMTYGIQYLWKYHPSLSYPTSLSLRLRFDLDFRFDHDFIKQFVGFLSQQLLTLHLSSSLIKVSSPVLTRLDEQSHVLLQKR